MYYVYILKSLCDSNQIYIGYTQDLPKRMDAHNSGKSRYTAKYQPWKLIMYLAFENEILAIEFEKYLKSGAGYAFAKKRFFL